MIPQSELTFIRDEFFNRAPAGSMFANLTADERAPAINVLEQYWQSEEIPEIGGLEFVLNFWRGYQTAKPVEKNRQERLAHKCRAEALLVLASLAAISRSQIEKSSYIETLLAAKIASIGIFEIGTDLHIAANELQLRSLDSDGGEILFEEFDAASAASISDPELGEWADILEQASAKVRAVNDSLSRVLDGGGDGIVGANAQVDFDMLDRLVLARLWLWQASAALQALMETTDREKQYFYAGKLHACRWCFRYELPRLETLSNFLISLDDTLITMNDEWF